VKDVKDLLDGSNYNFLCYNPFITKDNIKTNHLEYYKVVTALTEHFRKKKCPNSRNFTTLFSKTVLFRKCLQKDLSDLGQKKDFLTSEKPKKVAC